MQGSGVDNFLKVGGGLKIAHVKVLHYHAYFCMTTPHIMFAKKSGRALAPPPFLSTPL